MAPPSISALALRAECGPPKLTSLESWNGLTHPPCIGSGTHTPGGIPSAPG